MYSKQGIGLAGPQIGYNKSVIVYDEKREDLTQEGTEQDRIKKRQLSVLVNPVIRSMEGSCLSENEGCLSLPGFRADVKRAQKIFIAGFDRQGNELEIETNEFLSVILQHEIDHLNGVLFIDYVSSLKREMYRRRVLKENKGKGKKKKK